MLNTLLGLDCCVDLSCCGCGCGGCSARISLRWTLGVTGRAATPPGFRIPSGRRATALVES